MRHIFVLLAAATALAAQAPEAGQPTIRVTTRLVEVNVVARDRRGPVADLTKDDFTILDNGKRQTVGFFEKRTSAAPSAAPAAQPQPAAAITNRSPEAATYTIVLLDALDTDVMEQYAAKPQVMKFLRQVSPQNRVAIYTLGGAVRLEQDFTGNSALLVKTLDRMAWGAGRLWPEDKRKAEAAAARANAAINVQLVALSQAAGTTFISQNAGATAKHIQQVSIRLIALARYLGRFPGRKNLLWMTHAFPLVAWSAEPQLFAEEVSQVNHAFSDAGVAVYPIDTRGLIPMSQPGLPDEKPAPATGASQGYLHPMGGKGAPAVNRVPAGLDTMDFVARYTGGRAYHDTNDLFDAMHNAAADSEVTYILGFYADSASLDSRRHTLKVEVARSGVDLRYRQGYTATVEDPATRLPEKAQIAQAVWSPLETAGIALTAKYEKVDQPAPGLLRLTLSIAGNDVAIQPADTGYSGELALVYDARSAEGRDLGRISEVLTLQYDEDHYRTLPQDGIHYPHLLKPPAETQQIRIVVYDRNSGRVGSLTVPL